MSKRVNLLVFGRIGSGAFCADNNCGGPFSRSFDVLKEECEKQWLKKRKLYLKKFLGKHRKSSQTNSVLEEVGQIECKLSSFEIVRMKTYPKVKQVQNPKKKKRVRSKFD